MNQEPGTQHLTPNTQYLTPTRVLIPLGEPAADLRGLTDAASLELLPVGDRPLLKILLDELKDAGFTQAILVNGSNRRPVEEYARRAWPLMHVVRAETPRNLIEAFQRARSFLANEPFALAIPSHLIQASPSAAPLRRLRSLHEQHGGHVFAASPAFAGRAIFSSSIFAALDSMGIGSGGITDILEAASRAGSAARPDLLQPGEESVIIETLANYQEAFLGHVRRGGSPLPTG